MIALAICTLTYLPAVLIQDKIYLKEESRKLGMNSINFKPINGLDLIKNKLFTTDAVSRRSLKVFKKKQKLDIAKLLANAKSEQERAEILINAKVELFNQSNKALYLELQNLIKFADNLSADKLAALNRKKQAGTDKVDDLIQAKVDKLS
ncbi:MAG: hypothetical protein K2M43_00645, partial [Mycoplasmoidaceae bacterium]|nr:hypothetical protein [Mycoplasmoidaceae bacterium]